MLDHTPDVGGLQAYNKPNYATMARLPCPQARVVAYYMFKQKTKQTTNQAQLFHLCGLHYSLFVATLRGNLAMLCLSAWLGALPTRHVQKLKVYSKLGGNFLGLVDKHCMQNQDGSLIFYDTLRSLQDRVALIFKHEFLASKYIVIYVGAERLTKPNFPFVAQPDFEEQTQVVAVLQNAQSIAVMYDADLSQAQDSLRKQNLCAELTNNDLVVHRVTSQGEPDYFPRLPLPVLALPELDAWAFHHHIERIKVWYDAETTGSLVSFPYLQGLHGNVNDVDFKSLARTCKLLKSLCLCMNGVQYTLNGVSELSNLTEISMIYGEADYIVGDIYTCDNGVVLPCELGNLSKLTTLCFEGRPFCGRIPTELGKLQGLKSLSLRTTSLTHTVPTELGALSNLEHLDLQQSRLLSGDLPNFSYVKHVFVRGTPHLVKQKDKLPHDVWAW